MVQISENQTTKKQQQPSRILDSPSISEVYLEPSQKQGQPNWIQNPGSNWLFAPFPCRSQCRSQAAARVPAPLNDQIPTLGVFPLQPICFVKISIAMAGTMQQWSSLIPFASYIRSPHVYCVITIILQL